MLPKFTAVKTAGHYYSLVNFLQGKWVKVCFTESGLKNREECAANFRGRFLHYIKSFHVLIAFHSEVQVTGFSYNFARP